MINTLVAIGVDTYGTLVDRHEVSLHLRPLVGDLAEKLARHTARMLIPTCRHEVRAALDHTSCTGVSSCDQEI
jgi:hypothetical protein